MPVILITGNSMGLGYATAETLACNGHTVYATMVDWDDRSYYCGGTVPQGSKVRFSIAPDFDVIEKVINGCEDLKALKCRKQMHCCCLIVQAGYFHWGL